jgi:hypothetical protein
VVPFCSLYFWSRDEVSCHSPPHHFHHIPSHHGAKQPASSTVRTDFFGARTLENTPREHSFPDIKLQVSFGSPHGSSLGTALRRLCLASEPQQRLFTRDSTQPGQRHQQNHGEYCS